MRSSIFLLRWQPPVALRLSRCIVYKLTALFSLDAFAGGFVVQSLLALWLFDAFDLSLSAAGLFFLWSGVLAAFSFPVAARLVAHGSPPNPGSWLAENDSALAGDQVAPGLRTKGPTTQLP